MLDLSGTGDLQRDSRESIRANHSQFKLLFFSASGRFARIIRISDSRESPDSRGSCEFPIRANHATECWTSAGYPAPKLTIWAALSCLKMQPNLGACGGGGQSCYRALWTSHLHTYGSSLACLHASFIICICTSGRL